MSSTPTTTVLAAGVSPETLRKIETGRVATPSVPTIAAVARLIRAAGYAPVRIGGIDQSIRLEIFGDLHEVTLGRTLTEDEARRLV
ncbi:helix-turn-helix transcriptional regulator [Nonomuraea sp. B1E8]|uniref:helix-turn-helix transcriptional regulator n=1 Tax=unclassified Nonomuraea TaxID=2593643 RepID=UPI00325EBFB7